MVYFYMDMIQRDKEAAGIGIVLFSNRKYIFALGAFLINLKKHISYDGVIVYHDDFTSDDQKAIETIEPRVEFIKYGMNEFVKEFGFNRGDIENCYFVKNFTILSVIKFKIIKHLDEFSTVLLFDLDMLLLDNLDNLLEKDFDIAWRNGGMTIRNGLARHGFNDWLFKNLGLYDFYNETLIPNAGFIVVKRTFDYMKAYKEGVKYLRNISFRHPYHVDEILFAYIKHAMNLKAFYVDKKIYNVWPSEVSLQAKLIHFMGDYKPWNHQVVQAIFNEWRRNYEQFVSLTGIISREVVNFGDISKCLLQAHCHEKWSELFHRYGFVYPRELSLKPGLTDPCLKFSYYGIISYSIEMDQWTGICCCSCQFDKNSKNIPIRMIQDKLYQLAHKYNSFIKYQENKELFGLKTVGSILGNIPETFYKLYDITKEFREIPMTYFCEITTYHGSKLYVNVGEKKMVNSKEECGALVYAGVNGNRVSLFIKNQGGNIYIKKIQKDGRVSLSSQQTFFLCIQNLDQSISIDVKDGCFLSADTSGKIMIRHWNREWEHFFPQMMGIVIE